MIPASLLVLSELSSIRSNILSLALPSESEMSLSLSSPDFSGGSPSSCFFSGKFRLYLTFQL